MKNSTQFLGVCVVLLSKVLAVPAPPKSANNNHKELKLVRNSQGLKDHHVKGVILLRHLSSLQPRDYFSDLIRSVLGVTVKELLLKIESTFSNLNNVTMEGVEKLDGVITAASPEVQVKIQEITNNAINLVLETVMPFLEDLGLVLPIMSSSLSTHRESSAADIIWAMLNISLEDLVIAIANAMDRLLELLGNTIEDLKALASEARPEVGQCLVEISDNYLNQGRTLIIPILDQLRQLVDAKTSKSIEAQNLNLLDATVNSITGFNVQNAAFQAEVILHQLITLLESTRTELDEALALSDNAEVQTKVMIMYDNAMNNVIRLVKPFFTTLVQFQGEARHDKRFTSNLMNNLFGIGWNEFKGYIQFAIPRVDKEVKDVSTKIVATSFDGGFETAMKVLSIVESKLRTAEILCQPLVEILESIPVQSHSEIAVPAITEENGWGNEDGHLYNRDALINAISQILNFNVSDATRTLKSALESLDSLTEVSLQELDLILAYGEVDVRPDILAITNRTLTDIHITVQPLLDVLLPFLPDDIRSSKDVALDIYNGINGVKVVKFLAYCSSSAKKLQQLSNDAMVEITLVASRAGPHVHTEVKQLLQTANQLTQNIVKPVIDSLGPIITPL